MPDFSEGGVVVLFCGRKQSDQPRMDSQYHKIVSYLGKYGIHESAARNWFGLWCIINYHNHTCGYGLTTHVVMVPVFIFCGTECSDLALGALLDH